MLWIIGFWATIRKMSILGNKRFWYFLLMFLPFIQTVTPKPIDQGLQNLGFLSNFGFFAMPYFRPQGQSLKTTKHLSRVSCLCNCGPEECSELPGEVQVKFYKVYNSATSRSFLGVSLLKLMRGWYSNSHTHASPLRSI